MRNKAIATFFLTAAFGSLPTVAQQTGFHDNQERELTCDTHNGREDHVRTCGIREQTISSTGALHVDAGVNGGVSIKGWNRPDVLVRAKVEAWAASMGEAKSLASAVTLRTLPGDVSASGPQTSDDGGWSVSYEIFVPHQMDVTAKAHNGGLHVSDVGGRLNVETTNGGLHLARLTGDVKGQTVNGGVHVELMGDRWEGTGLDVSSTNGGVQLMVPEHYSARLESSTVNGGVHSAIGDVAAPSGKQGRNQSLVATLGSGGPTLHLSTVNGGVSISRSGE